MKVYTDPRQFKMLLLYAFKEHLNMTIEYFTGVKWVERDLWTNNTKAWFIL